MEIAFLATLSKAVVLALWTGLIPQHVRQPMELAILFLAAFVFTTRTDDQQ